MHLVRSLTEPALEVLFHEFCFRFSSLCMASSEASTQSQPIFIHSPLTEGELRKVTPKWIDKLGMGEIDYFTGPLPRLP